MISFKFITEIIFLCFSATSFSRAIRDSTAADTTRSDENLIYSAFEIDNPPVFRGPGNLDFQRWIAFELNRSDLKKKCPVGMDVNVSFIVTYSGHVRDIRIENHNALVLKDDGHLPNGCENTIVRIFQDSEKYWTGGSKYGRPVSVSFTIPIKFK